MRVEARGNRNRARAGVAWVAGLALACGPAGEPVAGVVEGDVAGALAELDSGEMIGLAENYLATDRPWRAAVILREWVRRAGAGVTAEQRLLAARAEAGWGAWEPVHELLEGVPGLEEQDGGIGLYLLARARDARGDATGAAEAYRAFLALPAAGASGLEREAARLRLGLALVRAGQRAQGRAELQAAARTVGGASVWFDLLEADALAQTGDTAAVRQAVSGYDAGLQGLRAWRARVSAARAAGDLAGARALANRARAWAGTNATRAEFLVSAGRIAAEMGEVAASRGAYRAAIALGAAGPAAREAAALLEAGDMTPEDHLAVARVHRAQGLHNEAVPGYELWLGARLGTAAERRTVQMEHANALFYAERYDDAVAALAPLGTDVNARFLLARAEAHRGRIDDAVRIYLDLASAHARGGTGTQALFLAAAARHEAGDMGPARELYRQVIGRYPGSSQMGLALMRLGGMAFQDGEHAEAARLFDQYRTRFPRGQLVVQATYWSGRAREAMGDAAGASTLFRDVRTRQRDGYYALLASQRLGVDFWPLPLSAAPAESPAAAGRVAGWVRGIDVLREAGFPDEASAEADRVVAAAGRDRPTLYALAEALAERGYSQRAIRIGLTLQGSGAPDRRLLQILYPFPYRTLIAEEARARGFDPFIAAALIRQESMFEARITSHVGARGLMQIMPATGRALAEAAGVEPWDDELLYHPEINVHLGTRYIARHLQNYDGSLPAVFSAYNAGWHRVEMWQRFPEFDNDELFTERIPFAETRGYVRILTRNLAIYRGLYGEG